MSQAHIFHPHIVSAATSDSKTPLKVADSMGHIAGHLPWILPRLFRLMLSILDRTRSVYTWAPCLYPLILLNAIRTGKYAVCSHLGALINIRKVNYSPRPSLSTHSPSVHPVCLLTWLHYRRQECSRVNWGQRWFKMSHQRRYFGILYLSRLTLSSLVALHCVFPL